MIKKERFIMTTIMLAAVAALGITMTTPITTAIEASAQFSSSTQSPSQEQLQECEHLDIPAENCNDLTIDAKKSLISTGAITTTPQIETGSQSTSPSTTNRSIISGANSTLYESEEGGFRVQIPQGWVIEDGGIIPANDDPTIEGVAILCLQNEALPDVGGQYNCQAANTTETIHILRYPDLQSNPALENVENITTNDLLALRIQELQNYSNARNIQLVNVTDDVSGLEKILDMTYDSSGGGVFSLFGPSTNEASVMFVLAEDKNTGYAVVNPRSEGDPKPEAVLQQVFNSFEIVS